MALKKGTKLLSIAAAIVTALIALTFLRPRLLRGIPSRLEPRVIWETAYFHLGNVAVTPELLTETLIFLILLTFGTRLVGDSCAAKSLSTQVWTKGNATPLSALLVARFLRLGCCWGCRSLGSTSTAWHSLVARLESESVLACRTSRVISRPD